MDTSKYSQENFDGGFERPPSNWFKFGKVGDVIRGTLVRVYEQDSTYQPGQKVKVYELEADAGFFHNIVDKKVSENPTELVKGDLWQVSGKSIIDRNMRRAELGQLVIMRYVGDWDAGKGNVAKTIEVKLGSIDKSFSAAKEEDKDEIPFA